MVGISSGTSDMRDRTNISSNANSANRASAEAGPTSISSSDTHDDISTNKHMPMKPIYTYEITGTAAHSRIAPLLPSHWVDVTVSASNNSSSTGTPQSVAAAVEAGNDSDEDAGSDTSENTRKEKAPESESMSPSPVKFLWSNAPRYHTKPYRDNVDAYSHLPNGTDILDDKWVLARLLGGTGSSSGNFQADGSEVDSKHTNSNRGLESHCFRGPDGFAKFCARVGMFDDDIIDSTPSVISLDDTSDTQEGSTCRRYAFPDLMVQQHMKAAGGDDISLLDDNNTSKLLSSSPLRPPPEPANLWVIKDAQSNGAGGIWVVDPTNARSFLSTTETTATPSTTATATTPLIKNHRYVAQRYAWPPMLYHGRKFHVRVYALITSEGTAYVHRKCFLHVANNKFDYCYDGTARNGKNEKRGGFDPSVHITNCCANSHDEAKFSGEICADLGVWAAHDIDNSDSSTEHSDVADDDDDDEIDIPLGEYFASISDTVATLTRKSMPYVTGGTANGGFEYLGLDFVLSTERVVTAAAVADGTAAATTYKPMAHLLEVNAPPSQDTATGLPHAEKLHDAVIRDLLTLWVIPRVDTTVTSQPGGWMCVYDCCGTEEGDRGSDTVPSKAAIINKMKWSIYEWKAARKYEEEGKRIVVKRSRCTDENSALLYFVRQSFPYYSESKGEKIFLENAGGAQVPASVIRAMNASLSNRHRTREGSRAKLAARRTLLSILGADAQSHYMFLAANATSLLVALAQRYVTSGSLGKDDEIIIATENHSANIAPWVAAAATVGAQVFWWTWEKGEPMHGISDLVTHRTRIVAISHASNVVGELRDVRSICEAVEDKSGRRADVVVDGVAAAPHVFPSLSECGAHWYAVSCHKLFGPHLGGLCGLKTAARNLMDANDDDVHTDGLCDEDAKVYKTFELGTHNFEACAGVGYGLGEYFASLSKFRSSDTILAGPSNPSKSVRNEQTSHESTEELNSCVNPGALLLVPEQVRSAYLRIGLLERGICAGIMELLRNSPRVVVVETGGCIVSRIPIVSFFHRDIDSDTIARVCLENDVVCRSDTFLAGTELTSQLASLGLNGNIVRLSFAHYNTKHETERVLCVLKTIEGW